MRLQSDIKVKTRNKIIGGPDFLICMPIVAGEKSDLFKEVAAIKQLNPDLLEWRIDGYKPVRNIDISLKTLAELRLKMDDIPLVFTCRSHSEGGLKKLTRDQRQDLLTAAMASGNLDIVDIELSNDTDFIQTIIKTARQFHVRVVLSHHNFKTTPEESVILDTLFKARESGADIAKIAVMPQSYHDVLTLLKATLKAREQGLKIPAISISMGSQGVLSRIAGGLFGSDITFASSITPSAPGQIPMTALKKAMTALYT
jgi:3-dehydroquinate dehydratase I